MKHAFTLIELLVVIAIIAILAAILFPVFAQAREKARQTACLSNQKQIALGVIQYIQDYDETFPSSIYPSVGVVNGVTRPVAFSIYDAVQPYLKNIEVLKCPSASPGFPWAQYISTATGGALVSANFTHVSYLPNLGIFGDNLCALGAPRKTLSPSLAGVPAPVDTILFFDGWVKTGSLEFFNFLAEARHSEGMNFSFADGHSKWFRWNGTLPGGVTPGASPATPSGTGRPAGVRYYSWNTTLPLVRASSYGTIASTATSPYNDFHGIPETNMYDSENYDSCP